MNFWIFLLIALLPLLMLPYFAFIPALKKHVGKMVLALVGAPLTLWGVGLVLSTLISLGILPEAVLHVPAFYSFAIFVLAWYIIELVLVWLLIKDAHILKGVAILNLVFSFIASMMIYGPTLKNWAPETSSIAIALAFIIFFLLQQVIYPSLIDEFNNRRGLVIGMNLAGLMGAGLAGLIAGMILSKILEIDATSSFWTWLKLTVFVAWVSWNAIELIWAWCIFKDKRVLRVILSNVLITIAAIPIIFAWYVMFFFRPHF